MALIPMPQQQYGVDMKNIYIVQRGMETSIEKQGVI
jgi:hypothetical protein